MNVKQKILVKHLSKYFLVRIKIPTLVEIPSWPGRRELRIADFVRFLFRVMTELVCLTYPRGHRGSLSRAAGGPGGKGLVGVHKFEFRIISVGWIFVCNCLGLI